MKKGNSSLQASRLSLCRPNPSPSESLLASQGKRGKGDKGHVDEFREFHKCYIDEEEVSFLACVGYSCNRARLCQCECLRHFWALLNL